MKERVIDLLQSDVVKKSDVFNEYYSDPNLNLRVSVNNHFKNNNPSNFSVVAFFYDRGNYVRSFRIYKLDPNSEVTVEDLNKDGNDYSRHEDSWEWVELR